MNEQLSHLVATIDYRFQKSIRYAEAEFGDFRISPSTRTPSEIVNHMDDVLEKTISALHGKGWDLPPPEALRFELEVKRFLANLKDLDAIFQQSDITLDTAKRLIQGPLSDMITHIGQLAMLSGLHGGKVPHESFFDSDI